MAIKLKNTDLKIVKGNTPIKSVMLGDKTIYGVAIQGPYIFSIYNNEATLTGLTEYGKQLSVINIPKSYNGFQVGGFGQYAFNGCPELTSITIPASLTSMHYLMHFDGCPKLASFAVDESNPVMASHQGILMDKARTSITVVPYAIKGDIVLPSTLRCISVPGFSSRYLLTSVTIPASVTRIENSAFQNCRELTSITVDKGNITYHSAGNCLIDTAKRVLVAGCKNSVIPTNGSVTIIEYHSFYGCKGLTSITIPNSVTSIGEFAFSHCSGLTSITIPNTVTSIGGFAFYCCSGLTTITIGSGVTSIVKDLFSYCSGLTSITIPNTVTSIGGFAFYCCSGLTSITIPSSVTSIEQGAFSDTAWLNNQPDGLVYAGKVAYCYKGAMPLGTSITLQADTTGVADYAFQNCSGLTSITIPNSVTYIGGFVFSGCSALTTINCEAASQPRNWDTRWKDHCTATVVWGYKGA